MPSPLIFGPGDTVARPIFGTDAALASGAVVSGSLGNGVVFSGNIGSGQVAWPHLVSGAVRSGHLADGAVVSGSIASGFLVGASHLGIGAATEKVTMLDLLIRRTAGPFGFMMPPDTAVTIRGDGLYNGATVVGVPSLVTGPNGVAISLNPAPGITNVQAGQATSGTGVHQLRWNPSVLVKAESTGSGGAIQAFVGLVAQQSWGTVLGSSNPNCGLVGFMVDPRGIGAISGRNTWLFSHKASGTAISTVSSSGALLSGAVYHFRIEKQASGVLLEIVNASGVIVNSYLASGNLPANTDWMCVGAGIVGSGQSLRVHSCIGTNSGG